MEAMLIVGGIGVLAFGILLMQALMKFILRSPPTVKFSGEADDE